LLQADYNIQGNNSGDPVHVRKTRIPLKNGSYLIYGTAHMHTTLYGQVEFNINLTKYF